MLEAIEGARKVLGEDHMYSQHVRCNPARLSALRGESERAVAYLREALEHGYEQEAIITDPDLASLHGDPEFEAIVAEVRRRSEEQGEAAE